MTDRRNPAGSVLGQLHLTIEGADAPVFLGTLALPIYVRNGSEFATYELGIDVGKVKGTLETIFKAQGARND